MESNNENKYTSHLRPPSQIASPGTLFEVSASAQNVRSSSMMPPPTNTLKRKTLAERGGETLRPAPAPPSSRQVNAAVKTTSIAGTHRVPSSSSSVSSRTASGSSARSISNSSFSSSVGYGSRPPSAQASRPHTAMSMSNSRIQLPTPAQSRSSSSMEVHPGTGVGKRSGRTPFSSSFNQCKEEEIHPRIKGSYDTLLIRNSTRASTPPAGRSLREMSLNTAMGRLTLDQASQDTPKVFAETPHAPSQIPKRVSVTRNASEAPSPSKSPQKTPKRLPQFLSRFSNDTIAWDTEGRLEDMERMCSQFKEKIDGATTESNGLKDMVADYKSRITELESIRKGLAASNATLMTDLDAAKSQLRTFSIALEDSKRYHGIELDDMQRQHRHELTNAEQDSQEEIRQLVANHHDEVKDLQRRLEDALENERVTRQTEIQRLASEGALSRQKAELEIEQQEKALRAVQEELRDSKANLEGERNLNSELRVKLSEAASNAISLESSMRSLRAQIDFLESDNKSQSHAFVDLEMRMQSALRAAEEAKDKLRIEETLRRKLHNQVQELKGNIRVFCRVRPSLDSDPVDSIARITYPDIEKDSKEVEVLGPEEKSSLGNITTKKHPFAFDRVFTPESHNSDVFGEISQLVQSALDGYNVCIFCYGQTGSGKTYTMSADDGMIPRAVHQIYDTAKSLEEKGWKYSMEGSFIEVYNENLNDLLGKPDEFDKKKHEIRHDMQKCKTTITDITTVDLDCPSKVESILRHASANRSVAATGANERSSRSHSVFILKLIGENSVTGEKSEGTLNLVDLAGSERLSHSKATGERLKETQNINKSLSCLGDVIGALGQGKEGGHVPYRNSKLTYLLQFSLGGNSKTLMFVMISPLQAHLSETLTSLKFATKVHNTHIGTARRQAKIRES